MAEALINEHYGDKFIACSAGTNPADQISSYAVKTMERIGIDISDKKPKPLQSYINDEFDFIITLYEKGNDIHIKYISKTILLHWELPDTTEFETSETEIMRVFSEVLESLNTHIRLFEATFIDMLDNLS